MDSGESTSTAATAASGRAPKLPPTLPPRKQRSSDGGTARVAALSSLVTLLVLATVLLGVLRWAPTGAWQPSQGMRRTNQTTPALSTAPCSPVDDAPSAAAAAAAPPPDGTTPRGVTLRRPVALMLGDSVTEFGDGTGWCGLMRYAYHGKLDVINRGLGGFTSRWYRIILEDLLSAERDHNITLAVLMFGTNDAAAPIDFSGEQWHVPVEEYRDNLVFMVEALRRANASNILMMAPPPVDDAKRVQWVKKKYNKTRPDRSTALVKPYAQAAVSVARQFGLPYVDLWTDLQKYRGLKDWGATLFHDGMHPSPAGHMEIFRLLTAALHEHMPELSTERMPSHYPSYWNLGAKPMQTLASLPLASLE